MKISIEITPDFLGFDSEDDFKSHIKWMIEEELKKQIKSQMKKNAKISQVIDEAVKKLL